jgi:ZIP family zinc transporter
MTEFDLVVQAFVWASLAASALLLGAVAGMTMNVSRTVVGLALGFGAGALFSAVAFELTDEAFSRGGGGTLGLGLIAGALVFFAGNRWIKTRGSDRAKLTVRRDSKGQGLSIVLGTVLDGIPESVVLGTMLLAGGAVSPAFFAAVLLSNVPEGFSATADLRKEGRSPRWILGLWLAVVLAAGTSAAVAFLLFDTSGPVIPFVQAFAAGGLLTMLVDTMVPEAYEEGGDLAGIVSVLGFALAFLVSALT